MIVGVVVLYFAELCVYKGTSIFKVMDKQNYWIRIILIYAEILMIMIYGMMGHPRSFILRFRGERKNGVKEMV